MQRALEAAGFSFNQHTTIRSNVHSVLMEKLWWTYPSTNRLVPFKDIVDADADADEEVSLGDDVPGTKIYKEFGYFGRINQLLQDLGEVQLNDQLWEAATDEARRKVAKLKQLKDHVTWRNERTESEFARFVPTVKQLDDGCGLSVYNVHQIAHGGETIRCCTEGTLLRADDDARDYYMVDFDGTEHSLARENLSWVPPVDGYIEVRYRQTLGVGRRFSTVYPSAQSIGSAMRGQLFEGLVIDLDMVNAGSVIELAMRPPDVRVQYPALTEYVFAREAKLQEVISSFLVTQKQAKNLFTTIQRGGRLRQWMHDNKCEGRPVPDFVRQYIAETQRWIDPKTESGLYSVGVALGLQQLWQQHPTHLRRDHVKKMAKRGIVIDADDVTMDQVQYRLKMQVLSGAGQHYENLMLASFERTLEGLGCFVDTLVYDGLHVHLTPDKSVYAVRHAMIENCIRDTQNNPTVDGYDPQKPYFDLSPIEGAAFFYVIEKPF